MLQLYVKSTRTHIIKRGHFRKFGTLAIHAAHYRLAGTEKPFMAAAHFCDIALRSPAIRLEVQRFMLCGGLQEIFHDDGSASVITLSLHALYCKPGDGIRGGSSKNSYAPPL